MRILITKILIAGVCIFAAGYVITGTCAEQQGRSTSSSISIEPGSTEDLRGITSVFIFTGKNDSLCGELQKGIEETHLKIMDDYEKADVILLLIPQATGSEPDFDIPNVYKNKIDSSKNDPLVASILQRKGDDVVSIIFTQQFPATQVDTARDELIRQFLKAYASANAK